MVDSYSYDKHNARSHNILYLYDSYLWSGPNAMLAKYGDFARVDKWCNDIHSIPAEQMITATATNEVFHFGLPRLRWVGGRTRTGSGFFARLRSSSIPMTDRIAPATMGLANHFMYFSAPGNTTTAATRSRSL